MLREERNNGIKNIIIKFLSVFLCIMICFDSYSDLVIEEYFCNLVPEKHLKSIFDTNRKNELSQNIINYNDIEDMIHLFNPEILNNWNSWENNKSSQDIYEEYQEAADKLFNGAASQDLDLQEAMLSAQGIAMQIQADKNASDSYTNFLTNYLIEKQLVLQTKILDLNYQKSAFELIKADEALFEATRKQETAKNSLNFGNGTQVDLLTAKKAVSDANSEKIIVESRQKTNKRNLLINCGKKMSDDVYVSAVDFTIYFNISTIDLNSDYQQALTKNIQREIYRRKIDNARTEEVKNEFKILYEASNEKIYNDLEKKYSDIIDALDTCNNRQISLNLAMDNYNKSNNELINGNISNKELSTARYNVEIAKANIAIANYDLKIAIEYYNAAVDGFSDC